MSVATRNHRRSRTGLKVAAALAVLLYGLPHAFSAEVPLRVNDVLHVAATGSAIQNCDALRSALNQLTGGNASDRFVVLLEPGTYFCIGSPLAVPFGVSLQGLAGRDQTLITGIRDNQFVGILHLYSNTQLRGLTVQNLAVPGEGSIAVSAWQIGHVVNDIHLHNVRLIGGQGGPKNWPLFASGATITAFDAILENTVRLEDSSHMDIHYSVLEATSPVTNSTAICHFSRNAAGARFSLNCTPGE